MIVVDGTSITGTIPTSWLATAHVSRPRWSKYYTVNSQVQNLSFSGMQLWQQSFQDPTWRPEVCSSFTKLAGYTSISQKPQYRYAGIEPIDQPSLDVTHQPLSARTRQDDVPTLPFLDKGPVPYDSDYYKSFLERSVDDFHLEGLPSTNLPSPTGQCPTAPWAAPVLAAWAAFGAALLLLSAGFIMWGLLIRCQPALVSWRPTPSGLACKLCWLCGHCLALLGLGLYVYNLITDILVVVAVWDLGFWWAKTVLAFILAQYVVRGFMLTVHLSTAEGISTHMHRLAFLAMPFVMVAMPIIDVVCCFCKCPHHPRFEVISSHCYRHLRILTISVFQALPNAAIVTVIYSQGSVPFSVDTTNRLLGALQHTTDPHFLSRSLFLQAVISSLTSVVWGIAGWLFLSIKHHTGLFKVLWTVVTCTVQHPRALLKEEAGPLPASRAGTYCMVQHMCMLMLRAMDTEF